MSQLSKKLIIFGAEYLVVFEGVLFFILAFQKPTIQNTFIFVTTGALLIGISFLVAHILKIVFHKSRPPKNQELFIPADMYAFPSEHATSLAALSVVVFRDNIEYGLIVLGIGVVVLTCRVLAKVHRVSDMVVGVALGTCISLSILVLL